MRLRLLLLLALLCVAAGFYFLLVRTSDSLVVDTIDRIESDMNVDIQEDTETDNEKQITIFALGDSLTAGYRLPLSDAYPSQLQDLLSQSGFDYKVVNGGKSGDTSAGLLARLDWQIADAQSGDIVLLVIGANDGLQSLSLTALETNLSEIVERLMDEDLRVVLGGMQLPTNLDPVYRENFASLYPRVATTYKLPLIPFFLENVATVASLNLDDGIHPTAGGYEIISRQVFDFLINEAMLIKN